MDQMQYAIMSHGAPIRRSGFGLPQMMQPDGTWKATGDDKDFDDARPVTQFQFDKQCAKYITDNAGSD